MKRAPPENVPQCALNVQGEMTGNPSPQSKGDNIGLTIPRLSASRGSGSNLHNAAPHRQVKQEPQYPATQEWPSTFDNSNTSWESDWLAASSNSFAKSNSTSGGFYKQRNITSPYQSSSNDWSTGESSTNSVPSGYAAMHASQQSSSNSLSASSSSYYENNNFYGGGYNNYDSSVGGYVPPSYRSTPQPYHQSMRPCDTVSGSYNGNRNPSSCPPTQVKPPIVDYNQRNSRYGMDIAFNKVQIKKEPEDYTETEGENFTSLFTKSLTSLYSEDPDNAFREDGKSYEPDVIICSPPSSIMDDQQTNYQRLGSSSTHHYNSNPVNYQSSRNNSFGFYESRNQTTEPPTHNVVELGSESDRTNSFRYDRPSFDDMHLYATSPNDSKSQAKKRKLSMPNNAPEGNFGTENRRKTPRLSAFKSDSKWTPNSFAFSDIQIKQEPEDDYPTPENEIQNNNKISSKDNSSTSNGNGNCRSPQQIDHPKPPPRKRSPAATCFDRFEKKSTPTNKKVSPLSVYAKVQDSIVLNVKCRRYKKRTKPIVTKEEVVYPGREEIENWKRTGVYSQTPDHAVRILMGEMLDQVTQRDGNNVFDGPDLSQLDPLKIKELLFQFCQRYSMDFRDFENINNVLKPRIVKDKMAKNSERASAIRKRTSISPAQTKPEVELVNKTSKSERVPKKVSNEDLKPAVRRVLRNLPGRENLPEVVEQEIRPSRRRSRKTPIVNRRYSTRSAKDVDDKNSSDIDIIIDSSTDRESEAGKEAEVRKKSERLKKRQPVVETPAKDRSSDRLANVVKDNKKVEPHTRSRDKSKDKDKSKDTRRTEPKKWSRLHNSSNGFLRSPSIEIVDITRSDSSSPSDLSKDMSEPEYSPVKKTIKSTGRNCRKSSERSSSRETSRKAADKGASTASNRRNHRSQDKKPSDNTDNKSLSEDSSNMKRGNKLLNERPKTPDTSANSDTPKHKKGVQDLKDSNKKHVSLIPVNANNNQSSKTKRSQPLKDSSDKKDDNKQMEIDSDDSNPKKGFQLSKKTITKNEAQIDTNSKTKKSKLVKESDKNKDITPSRLSFKIEEDLELQNHSDEKKEDNAAENEKSGALLRISKSKSRANQRNSDKRKSQAMEDKKQSLDTFKLKKIKEEPISPNLSSNKVIQFEYPPKKENKQITEHKTRTMECVSKAPEEEKQIVEEEVQNKAAKNSVHLPQKKFQPRRSSHHSDSELQVVLTKLPDVHINSKMSSFPLEFFEKCESKDTNKPPISADDSKSFEDTSSVGSPPELVCMKDVNKVQDDLKLSDQDSACKESSDLKDDPSIPLPSLIHCDMPENCEVSESYNDKEKPHPIMQLRYSVDSVDSECGLVIDLDRRASVEEQTSVPEVKQSDSADEEKDQETPEMLLSFFSNAVSSLAAREEITASDVGTNATSPAEDKSNDIQQTATEEGRISVPPAEDPVLSVSPTATTSDVRSETPNESTSAANGENNQTSAKDESRAESILRSLLLETTADGSTGPSRPSTSSSAVNEDSKARMAEDFRSFLNQGSFLSSMSPDDPLSAYDDMKLALDQLPDINANLLADTEECIRDPKMFNERVNRLKHEIMYLQCVAYQKEKERIGMICLKSFTMYIFRYMEEVMRRLIEKFNFEQQRQEQIKDGESTPEMGETSTSLIPECEASCSCRPESEASCSYLSESSCSFLPEPSCSFLPDTPSPYHTGASTSAETSLTEDTYLQSPTGYQNRKLSPLALSIVKSEETAAVKEDRSSPLSGENLPTVETMIANATENYGIDLRTVKRSSSSAPTKQTILQKVLSSKESVYSQPTSGSTNEMRNTATAQTSTPKQSMQMMQKKIPSGGESPFKPFHPSLSPVLKSKDKVDKPKHQNILQKVLRNELVYRPSPSQSPPSLLSPRNISIASPSTSFDNDLPLDFSLNRKSEASSASSNIPPASTKHLIKKSKSPRSSLKRSSNTSYSIWSSAKVAKNKPTANSTSLMVDNNKNGEALTIKTEASIPGCSNSEGFAMRLSANDRDLPSKPIPVSAHQQKAGTANHVEKSLKSCVEKIYSKKTEEELRPLSYSSLVTSSNDLSCGGRGGGIAPTFTMAKPPETTTPNGSPYRCMGCGISDAKFLCSGCRKHWYCSAQCQNMRWPEHSQVCPGSMYSKDEGPSYP